VCGDSPEAKRVIAELYLVKAVVADSLGDWIQSYFSVKEAAEWNRQVMSQSLQIGEKAYNIPTFFKQPGEQGKAVGQPGAVRDQAVSSGQHVPARQGRPGTK